MSISHHFNRNTEQNNFDALPRGTEVIDYRGRVLRIVSGPQRIMLGGMKTAYRVQQIEPSLERSPIYTYVHSNADEEPYHFYESADHFKEIRSEASSLAEDTREEINALTSAL